jgi:protein-S-isoprenylcysteine O-methyltransferase Ste14
MAFTRSWTVVQGLGAGLISVGVIGVFVSDVFEALGRLRPVFSGGLAVTVGAATASVGIAVATLSEFSMGASYRIGVDQSERTVLVTRGPFRLVRNPIFSGMMATVAGVFLLAPSAASVAAVLAVLVGIEIQVRAVEEPHLMRARASEYGRYARSVGRFLPGVGRLR